MNDEQVNRNRPVNKQRRTLIQGAALVGAASFAPAVFSNTISNISEPVLSGKLICDISNPIKTLVLHNHTDQTIIIENLSQSAFMFDGSIVDCKTAVRSKAITIPANKEIQVQFDKRHQTCLTHRADEFQRIQSRVTRLSDGTRIVPFVATLHNGTATLA